MDDVIEIDDEGFLESANLGDSGARCTVFVLDVGEPMFEEQEQGVTYLQQTFKRLGKHLNYLALNADLRDKVAVIFINAPPEKSTNGIFVLEGMGNVSKDLVSQVYELADSTDFKSTFAEKFGQGSSQSDVSEIVFACRRYFSEAGRVAQKRVIFYSWNYDPYGDDELTKRKHLEVVAKRLAKIETDIHFTAVLIGHPLGAKPNEYWDTIDPGYKYRAHEVEPAVEFLESSCRSAATVPFFLGEGVELAVACFSVVKERPKPRHQLIDAETNEAVQRESFYVVKNGPDAPQSISNQIRMEEHPGEIAVEQRLKLKSSQMLHKTEIGGRKLALTQNEVESLRRIEPPGMRLLGFKPLDTLKASHRMGDSIYLYPIDNVITGSKNLYNAMYRSCLRKGVYAVVRCTFRANTSPKLYALIPQAGPSNTDEDVKPIELHSYEGFHAVQLPLQQNKRSLQEEYAKESRQLADPDAPVPAFVSSFVDKLTSNYTPEQFLNPAQQGHMRMMESLVLNYSFEKCAEISTGLDNFRPWFEDEGARKKLGPELGQLFDALAGADPSDQKLAQKRRLGGRHPSHGAKRGKK